MGMGGATPNLLRLSAAERSALPSSGQNGGEPPDEGD
eukprot:CAMPEP_0195100238 /NCGR_PEP_ID=MMETSP0448-20130528/61976_1 /TAXON_ID=66468 /ORGANISM="Heterocapsa triquestra, Strain CCMP 448" /LENGTH=36 /DNA_ID= /DNA_START= /DNA_END= /DNA_ORIENTATION=